METNKILQANLLDLLFDGKNKDYGAYELRKSYSKRVITSLGIVTSGLICLIIINIAYGKSHVHTSNTITEPRIVSVDLKPKIEPKKEKLKNEIKEKHHDKTPFKQVSKDPVKMQIKKYVEPRIVPDELFDPQKNLKKTNELVDVKIGRINQDGPNITVVGPAIKVNGAGGSGLGSSDPSDHSGGLGNNEKGDGDIADMVQKEALYPTGKEGWLNYLHRSLRSDVPTENGAPAGRNYSVIVSFIVDIDGSVSHVVAENDPGYGTAAEAVRAIRNSGKWIPAMQNGKKVKYRQRQQITFQVTEE